MTYVTHINNTTHSSLKFYHPLSLSLSVLKYLELISKQVTVSHCLAERVSTEDITKERLGEKPRPPTGVTNVSNGDDRIKYLVINDSID